MPPRSWPTPTPAAWSTLPHGKQSSRAQVLQVPPDLCDIGLQSGLFHGAHSERGRLPEQALAVLAARRQIWSL